MVKERLVSQASVKLSAAEASNPPLAITARVSAMAVFLKRPMEKINIPRQRFSILNLDDFSDSS